MIENKGICFLQELADDRSFPEFGVSCDGDLDYVDVIVTSGSNEKSFSMIGAMLQLVAVKFGLKKPEFLKDESTEGVLVYRFNFH